MATWKRALITGASSGIGAAFAQLLAAQSTAIVLVARRDQELRRIGAEFTAKYGVEAEPLAADLSNPEQVRMVEDRLERTDKPIDLLINNVGSETEHGFFLRRDRDRLTSEVQLNVMTLMRLTHAALAGMINRRRGGILNISAGAAFYPVPGSATYAASKAFVNSFTEALSYEVRDLGISVSAICPGFTRTGAQARLGLQTEIVPPRFWKDPQDVAEAGLRAVAENKVITNVSSTDGLIAFLGSHLPRRIWMRRVLRTQKRLYTS